MLAILRPYLAQESYEINNNNNNGSTRGYGGGPMDNNESLLALLAIAGERGIGMANNEKQE